MRCSVFAAGLVASTVLASTFLTGSLAGPALAQGAAQGTGSFVTEQGAEQWRASKLMGVDVYGSDNAKIGDIRDVLLDRSGQAGAVVIGVGGFLGLGEKTVAVPYAALEWSNDPVRSATSDGTARDASAAGTTSAPGGAATAPTTAQTTAPTGSSTSSGAPLASGTAANRGYPDHAVLRMSKADLQGAPDFHYAGARPDAAATNTAPPSSGLSSPVGGGGPTGAPGGTPAPSPRQ